MSQLVVNDHPTRTFEGQLAHQAPVGGIVSAIASGRVLFGKAAGRAVTDVLLGDNATGAQEAQALDATNSHFLGIALADVTKETVAGQAYASYEHEETIPILKRGRIWVVSNDAVDDLSKNVFVRNAAEGALPAEALGSFRATTVANYIDLTAIAAVRWVAADTIGGIEFGLLEINLP